MNNLRLTNTVGRSGQNQARDVRLVRALLNVHRRAYAQPPLAIDPSAGHELDAAIALFQSDHGVAVASGLIRPDSQSWAWLQQTLANSRTHQSIVPPTKGRLTWEAEGHEGGRYHSRILHVPSASSGLTIGRGYDLKERSRAEVTRDLAAAGLAPDRATVLAGAVHLAGEAAEQFIIDQDLLDFEITPGVQLALFETVYEAMEQDVIRICTKRDVVERYGRTDWGTLDARIRDTLVDLRFRGDYTPVTRRQIQPPVVANDLVAFRQVMGQQSLWSRVPADRFQRRVRYLA
ncbi:hypothetical protein QQM79_03450 [Marinobacteraceae bacterium S3BR75-40.1]